MLRIRMNRNFGRHRQQPDTTVVEDYLTFGFSSLKHSRIRNTSAFLTHMENVYIAHTLELLLCLALSSVVKESTFIKKMIEIYRERRTKTPNGPDSFLENFS